MYICLQDGMPVVKGGKQVSAPIRSSSLDSKPQSLRCCSVLQCVAACCSVLQCVAVCCSLLLCVAVFQTAVFQVWWRYKALLHKHRDLYQRYRGLLQTYRAFWRIYTACLQRYMALLQNFFAGKYVSFERDMRYEGRWQRFRPTVL